MLYLNNAATSFPKPPDVLDAVAHALRELPQEPGRGSTEEDPLQACRDVLARLFGVAEPARVALLPSATHALNTALSGLLRPGDHVVTTMLEHNSVLRPLAHLATRGVLVTQVSPDDNGVVGEDAILAALTPVTRAVAISHASNVTGAIQPIEAIARALAGRAALVVDAAQSAGCVPIAFDALPGRCFVAFAGHKGLYGPTGTGGLLLADDALEQSFVGGTGSLSESELHPGELPLRHEAGTPNLPGIAGLRAGAEFVARETVAKLGAHRHRLVVQLRAELARLGKVRLSPLAKDDGRAGVVSFTVDGWPAADVGYMLRESFEIEVRTGLHCAPLAHSWLGTAPDGTVRVSVSAFNQERDVGALVEAIEALSATDAR